MSTVGALIAGVILLVLAYYGPRIGLPPPIVTILQILGWILVIVAIILIVLGLVGVSTGLGTIR